MAFTEITADKLMLNPFKFCKEDWFLVTAGDTEKANTLTAGWGGLGVYCQKNVATIYIRPQRYTKEFIDRSGSFSITAFSEDHKKQLGYLGRVSGRDEDKIAKVGYSLAYDGGTPYIAEGKLVLICKTVFHHTVETGDIDDSTLIEAIYPNKDFHTIYIAEITKILVRE